MARMLVYNNESIQEGRTQPCLTLALTTSNFSPPLHVCEYCESVVSIDLGIANQY